MLCVWDLTTGACVYSIQAHDGAVLSLAYSPSYVVSMGSDEKLCVWERFQGQLINTINLVNILFLKKTVLYAISDFIRYADAILMCKYFNFLGWWTILPRPDYANPQLGSNWYSRTVGGLGC